MQPPAQGTEANVAGVEVQHQQRGERSALCGCGMWEAVSVAPIAACECLGEVCGSEVAARVWFWRTGENSVLFDASTNNVTKHGGTCTG